MLGDWAFYHTNLDVKVFPLLQLFKECNVVLNPKSLRSIEFKTNTFSLLLGVLFQL